MASALPLLLLIVAQHASLDELVRARAERAAAGDIVAADRILGTLLASRSEEEPASGRWRNLPLASWSLVQEARIALASGEPSRVSRAVFLAEAAAKLSPDLPATHATLLSAYLAHPPATSSMIAGAAISMVGAMFGGVPLANLIADLVAGVIAAILALALAQIVKHGRLVGWWLLLFALAPPLLELGVLTSACLVLAATYTYASVGARRAAVVAWCGCAFLPFLIEGSLAWTLKLDAAAHEALVRSLLAPFAGALPSWSIAVIAAACAAIAVAKSSPAPAARARATPALLAIVPGASDLAGDRPLRGALLFAAFSTTLAAIWWLDGLLPDPNPLGVDLPGPIPKLFAAAASIAILVLLSTQRPRAWR